VTTTQFCLFALSVLVFGLVSRRAQRGVVTPPIVFVVLGYMLGEHMFGVFDFARVDERSVHLVAEVTLIVILFTDAARIDLRALWKDHDIPVRLLGVGLPLTILLGGVAALLVLESLNIWEAMLVAAILAPTDAALGQSVVTNRGVPARIRQALNIESGLNDGLALPVVLLFASLAAGSREPHSATYWMTFAGKQLLLGPLVGIAIGYAGGFLIRLSSRAGWMSGPFERLAAIALAVLAYSTAELEFLGGNGFIAAFVAGLTVGNCFRGVCSCLFEFGEAEGTLLTIIVFFIFGGLYVPYVFEHLDISILLYAGLSLSLIRILPVALSLAGKKLRLPTVAFLGWFGPRGLASILYVLLILEESTSAGSDRILVVVMATVLLSVLAHGLTASPGSLAYAAGLRRAGDCAERDPVSEMPARIRLSD